MKKYENSQSIEDFQFSPRKFAIQTWLCNCPQYLCLFHIVFECSPSIHDQGKMLVLPNQPLHWVLSTSDQCLVSFQPIWCHPHTKIRITLFHSVRTGIPNLEFSPSHVLIGFSQIAFPIIVLPKDDHTDFVQEERLDLPYWTMILAICVVVDESICLDIPILEFFNNVEASSNFTWEKADTVSAACPSQPGNLEMISLTFAAVICGADDPCSVITAKDPESSFTMSPQSTTRPLYFWCCVSNTAFFKWLCPSVRRNELLRPSSSLHRSLLSYFWLSSGSTPKFSPIFPIPCPLLPLLREFFMAWGVGINLCTKS